MKTSSTLSISAALVVGHIAGMIDLASLPLWVDTLITGYGYRPATAGLLPTGFLVGVVGTSLLLARGGRFPKGRLLAPIGYWIAAAALLLVPTTRIFSVHLALHVIGGLAVGLALSSVHRAMGHLANPHRIFSMAGLGFGLFTLVFLGAVPQLVASLGPDMLFTALGGTMLCAAIVTTFLMPADVQDKNGRDELALRGPLPTTVKFAIAGIMAMALVQAMVFSFLVQVGSAHGFGMENITAVLITLGVVNLFPPALAALLEKRLSAIGVARIAPIVQGLLALLIMVSPVFGGYAFGAAIFSGVLIFTHTFVFGFLAREDSSGRAVAATPAMMMTGSAPLRLSWGARWSSWPDIRLSAPLPCWSQSCRPRSLSSPAEGQQGRKKSQPDHRKISLRIASDRERISSFRSDAARSLISGTQANDDFQEHSLWHDPGGDFVDAFFGKCGGNGSFDLADTGDPGRTDGRSRSRPILQPAAG